MSSDLDKSCNTTAEWLQQGFGELVSQVASDMTSKADDVAPVFQQVADHFFSAIVAGRHQQALALAERLPQGDHWLKLIRVTCERLETEWQQENLFLSDAIEGFAATQRVFNRLSGRMTKQKGTGTGDKSCLFWVQPGDLHTLGVQVLAEVFDLSGWSATPLVHDAADAVFDRLAEGPVDLFGLSIGSDEHLLGVADIVTEARIRSQNPKLTVMLGGAAIEGNLSQYRFLGADILAKDAESALVQVDSQFNA